MNKIKLQTAYTEVPVSECVFGQEYCVVLNPVIKIISGIEKKEDQIVINPADLFLVIQDAILAGFKMKMQGKVLKNVELLNYATNYTNNLLNQTK